MNKSEWKSVLDKWNKDILNSRYQAYLPEEVHATGWVGFSGATQEEITSAEVRLQTKLPESYRAFLSVTNGWRMTTPFIDRVWGTEEIEWLAVKRKKVVENGRRNSGETGESNSANGELYKYGEAQDLFIRPEHFENSLEVAFGDQLDLYLLLPDVTPLEGEWAACLWSPKSVESIVYRSFWELMLAEYESFLRLKDIE